MGGFLVSVCLLVVGDSATLEGAKTTVGEPLLYLYISVVSFQYC